MQRQAKIIVLTPILTQLYATLSLSSHFQNEEFSPCLFVVVDVVVVVFFVVRKL